MGYSTVQTDIKTGIALALKMECTSATSANWLGRRRFPIDAVVSADIGDNGHVYLYFDAGVNCPRDFADFE